MKTYGTPSTRAIPVIAVTAPVQKVGQAPGSESPGSHVVRYGDRTANGTAGGRSGSKVEETAGAATAAVGKPSDSTPAASAARPPSPAQRNSSRRDGPTERRSGASGETNPTRYSLGISGEGPVLRRAAVAVPDVDVAPVPGPDEHVGARDRAPVRWCGRPG